MSDAKDIDSLITLRNGEPGDENFIYSTWLNGLYYGNSWPANLLPSDEQKKLMTHAPFDLFGQVQREVFLENYRRVIRALLARSTVTVACLASDPDVMLGYAVITQDRHTLHWVYVKASWRKHGIARRLIPATITTVTHLTRLGLSLKPKSWGFNPFVI